MLVLKIILPPSNKKIILPHKLNTPNNSTLFSIFIVSEMVEFSYYDDDDTIKMFPQDLSPSPP